MVRYSQVFILLVIAVCGSSPVTGGIRYNGDQNAYVEIGGRLQLQYHLTNPNRGETTDELRFRRLRPYIQASRGDDWYAKIQWDMGKETIDLRDVYTAYTGWDAVTVYLGNYFTPFSRESLASSKRQQLVERTLVGDHNYGVSDRQAGIHLVGELGSWLTWSASFAKAATDPDNSRIDFDTVVSLDRSEDWSEGEMVAGRADWHPLGPSPLDQGDFKRNFTFSISLAGYAWQNDKDNLDPERTKKDIDQVAGVELSAGIRGCGVSVDVEYNRFESDLIEPGISDGLYLNSESTLENAAIEGGYMVLRDRLELVAGYEVQDTDAYDHAWTRVSCGANLFIHQHKLKYQATYRMGENIDGHSNVDADEIYVQAQYVF